MDTTPVTDLRQNIRDKYFSNALPIKNHFPSSINTTKPTTAPCSQPLCILGTFAACLCLKPIIGSTICFNCYEAAECYQAVALLLLSAKSSILPTNITEQPHHSRSTLISDIYSTTSPFSFSIPTTTI